MLAWRSSDPCPAFAGKKSKTLVLSHLPAKLTEEQTLPKLCQTFETLPSGLRLRVPLVLYICSLFMKRRRGGVDHLAGDFPGKRVYTLVLSSFG